jgi:hypothetical protein
MYVDFGDRWPGGSLSSTVGALKNTMTAGNPKVDGPDLFDDFGNQFPANTTFRLRSFNRSWQGNDAQMRSEIMEFTRRMYEPFDITVVELTANFQDVNGFQVRAAANLNEVSDILGLNEAATKNNDTYVFVGEISIGGNQYNPALSAYGGISTGTDIGLPNNNDGAVLVLLTGLELESSAFLGSQVGHEAGHAFGLLHTFGNFPSNPPSGSGIDATLPESDIMSYRSYDTFGGFNFITRYPMVAGDGNTNKDTLSTPTPPAPPTQRTPADQWLFDASIGPSPLMNYVTGTGAHDVITLTRTGNDVTVTVEAFEDDGFAVPITVPGTTVNSYTYTFANDKPTIRIDGGARNDRFVIDASLGVNIDIFGMHGNDELVIDGKNAVNATYTPDTNTAPGLDGNPDRRGTIVLDSMAISFLEFEQGASTISLKDVGTFTFQSPGGADNLEIIDAGAGATSVQGTVDSGLDFIPIVVRNAGTFAIDVGNNDFFTPDDLVKIGSALTAPGLQNVIVSTGIGADTLEISTSSLGLPVAGGGYTFNAGDGDDKLSILASALDLPTLGFTYNGGTGNDTLEASLNSLTLAPGAGSVGFVFNGDIGDDTVTLMTSDLSLPAGAFQFAGDDGNDTFTLSGTSLTLLAGTTPGITFIGGGEDDQLRLNLTGDVTVPAGSIAFTAGAGNDLVDIKSGSFTMIGGASTGLEVDGGLGDDQLLLTATTTMTLPGNAISFMGADGADTLRLTAGDINVNGGPGPASITFDGGMSDDVFTMTATGAINLPAGGIAYSGGDGLDTLTISAANLTRGAGVGGPGIAFDGGLGHDRLSFTITTNITLNPNSVLFNGGNDNDTLVMTANRLNLALGGLTMNGGDGNDLLDTTFSTLVSIPSGAGAGVLFDGGNGDDRLRITSPADLTLPAGSFKFIGGIGNDRLDVNAPNLTLAPGAAGPGLSFEAGAGDDRLIVAVGTLTLPAGGFTFNGGEGNDRLDVGFATLTLPGGAPGIGFTFNGGTGIDTIAALGPSARTWVITNPDTGVMNGRLAFQIVENILGDTGGDTFIIGPAGRMTGIMEGAGGQDTLNLSFVANVVAALLGAGATDGFNVAFAGPVAGNLRNINRVIAAPTGRDTFQSTAAGQWVLSGLGNTYAATTGGQIAFAGFEAILGSAGPDQLFVRLANGTPIPTTGLLFDGQGGFDSVRIDGSAGPDTFVLGASFVMINGRALSFIRSEDLDVAGGVGNDTFISASATLPLAQIDLIGGDGSDTFYVTPTTGTVFRVFGDAPFAPTSPGDQLILRRTGIQIAGPRPLRSAATGRYFFVGRQFIDFFGIESINEGRSQLLPD